MIPKYIYIVLLFAFVFIPLNVSGNYKLPDEYLTLRVNPAVFKILTYLDYEYSCPVDISLRKSGNSTILETDYQNDLNSSRVSPNYSKADYFWENIAVNPEKYLETSNIRTRFQTSNGSGSGFFVSREGIILTNAHVVQGPEQGLLPNVLDSSLIGIITSLSSEIKSGPPPYLDNTLLNNLTSWYTGKCTTNNQLTGIYLVLDYLIFDENYAQAKNIYNLLIPLTVMAQGKPIIIKGGGKDVAVLKIKDSFEYICPSGEKINLSKSDFYDKFISIRLGNSDEVLEGMDIDIFGFPGGSFLSNIMNIKSDLRASSDDGKIGPIRKSYEGWDIFEMSARSRPGDSGGPVVNKNGEVIALSAAMSTINDKSSYAIPINIAKEFLKSAGVNPDPGPLTKIWEEALSHYAKGEFKNSELKLSKLKFTQLGNLHYSDRVDSACTISWLSPYVKDMFDKTYNKTKIAGGGETDTEFHNYILKGINFAEEGKYNNAISEFTNALSIKPRHAETYFRRGSNYSNIKKYNEAISDFSKGIEYSSNPEVKAANYSQRSIAYFRLKYYENTIYNSNKAIEYNKNLNAPYMIRGTAFSLKKRYERAINDINRFIENDQTNFADAKNTLESTTNLKEENDRLIIDLTEKIKLDPLNSSLYYQRCTYNLRYGSPLDTGKAVDDCTKAINLNPEFKQAYNNRGMGQIDLGNYQHAVSDINKAIAIDQNYALAYESLGEAYVKIGKYDDAISNFQKALQLDPNLLSSKDYMELAKTIKRESQYTTKTNDNNVKGMQFDFNPPTEELPTFELEDTNTDLGSFYNE